MNKPSNATNNDSTVFLAVLMVIGLIVPVMLCGFGFLFLGVRNVAVAPAPAPTVQTTNLPSAMTTVMRREVTNTSIQRSRLPADDPRVVAARKAIREELVEKTELAESASVNFEQDWLEVRPNEAWLSGVFVIDPTEGNAGREGSFEYRCRVENVNDAWQVSKIEFSQVK